MPENKQPEPPAKALGLTRDRLQRASIAQLLLVARLKARNRRDLAVDSLERAAHVIFVTCKNWFSMRGVRDAEAGAQTPPESAPISSPDNNDKATDAHRHH